MYRSTFLILRPRIPAKLKSFLFYCAFLCSRQNQNANFFREIGNIVSFCLRYFYMILGLTGAIGSGKSAVLAIFDSLGWKTVDSDRLCHQLYDEASRELLEELRENFGAACIGKDNKVARSELAAVVFGNPEKLEKLNNIIIPYYEKRFQDFIDDCRSNKIDAICEVPLLFEKGYEKKFDAVVGIWTPENIRYERLEKFRNLSAENASKREKLQLSAEKKIEYADFCIVNDGSIDELKKEITLLVEQLNKTQN